MYIFIYILLYIATFFQVLSTNVTVRDVVHYETQMVHILRVYQLMIGLFLSILSLALSESIPLGPLFSPGESLMLSELEFSSMVERYTKKEINSLKQ